MIIDGKKLNHFCSS